MYELISNNSTYKVPLESLDLSYLTRQFYDGSKRPMPLWRIPKCEEYYEFKINAWRTAEEEGEDADIISSESQLCHICNIHVPVIYIKEHNSSEIHSNMRKILNLMVVRGRNADLSPSDKKQAQNCYYCEDCSIVIPESSKKNHEATYTHKKSQRNKSLIEQFLKFYSEDFTENANNKILPLQDYFNKYVNRKNFSFKINVIDEDSLGIIVQDKMFTINCDNFHGFMKTDAELICILCEMSVVRVAKLIEQHIGSKKHRKKMTLLIDDHCLREFNDSFAHCIPCNELVLLYRIEFHKMTSHHIANLNLAKGRKYCRDINKNYISPEDISDYRLGNSFRKYLRDELADKEANCDENEAVQDLNEIDSAKNNVSHNTNIVSKCNPTFKDKHGFDYHIDKKLIHTHVEQLLSSKNNDYKEKIEVEDCDYIHKTYAETDVPTNNHVANLNQMSCEESINTNKPNINLSEEDQVSDNAVNSDPEQIDIPADFLEQVDYLILETTKEKEIICKVCNILMLNTDSTVYTHFNGDNHTTEYNDLLKSNRVTKAQKKFFCYSCKVSITSKNELVHIFGIKHRNKFANNTDVRIYCEFCKMYLSDSVEEHQNTKQHSQGYKMNEKNVPTEIVEEDADSSDNTSDILSYHDSDLLDTDEKNIALGEKTVNIPAVFLKLHYHFTKTLNPAEVLCKICNLVVPNTVVTIDTHVEGFYHSNKYDNLLKYNRIKSDGSRFHCQICDVFVTFKNEIEHIAGTKHKGKVADEQNNDVQSSDEASDDETVPTSLGNKDDESNEEMIQTTNHIQENIEIKDDKNMQDGQIETGATTNEKVVNVTHAASIQPEYWKIHYHMSKTSNNNEVLCKICNVTLSRSIFNVNSHVQGNNHSNRYRDLLQSNQIECQGLRFHCKICDVFVAPKNEIEHIEGNKHKNRMTDKISTDNPDDDDADDQQTDYTGDEISEYTDDQISEYTDDQISDNRDDQISDEEISQDSHYTAVADPAKETCERSNQILRGDESTQAANTTAVNVKQAANIQPDYQKIHYHMSIIDNSEVLCKVCNVILSYSIVNVNTHVQGNNHSRKYIALLESNKVENNGLKLVCKICDVLIPLRNEIEHISGSKHKSKVAEQISSQKTDDEDSNELSDDENSSEAVEEDEHLVKADQILKQVETNNNNDDESTQETKVDIKPHYHFTKTTNNSDVLCKICNVVLSNSVVNIDTHIKGNNHLNNYNVLLENNKVEKDDNVFRCRTCDVVVSNKNEIDHIFGFRHKTKMQNAVNNTQSINDESDPTQVLRQALSARLENLEMRLNEMMLNYFNSI